MSTRTLVTISFACLGAMLGACDRKPDQTPMSDSRPPATAPATRTDADNTDRNKVDRDSASKTPMDQSNASADIKITAEIRRAILDDASLSVKAKNCKVITDKSGAVTLRGPVDTQAEKDAIEAKAKSIAGVRSVVNELEVKMN